MNKKAIAKTALCRYDEKEQSYVVESPLFERVTGVAETESCLASSLFACRDSLILPLDYPVISAQI